MKSIKLNCITPPDTGSNRIQMKYYSVSFGRSRTAFFKSRIKAHRANNEISELLTTNLHVLNESIGAAMVLSRSCWIYASPGCKTWQQIKQNIDLAAEMVERCTRSYKNYYTISDFELSVKAITTAFDLMGKFFAAKNQFDRQRSCMAKAVIIEQMMGMVIHRMECICFGTVVDDPVQIENFTFMHKTKQSAKLLLSGLTGNEQQ